MFAVSDYLHLLHQLEQYFTDSANLRSIANPIAPDTLKEQLSLELTAEGKPLNELNADIAQYLIHNVKTGHPRYFNQLWGGFSAPCLMGDMLTSATNTSMYTYEVAPVATLIEKTLIAKLGTLVGFSNPEGQFTTGGSNGNLMAMAMARHRAMPSLKQTGLINAPKLIAFVSEEAHYSFDKAAHLLGIGIEQLWKVPVDANGQMIVAQLEALIVKAHLQGAQPFFVAATAGTTVRGAYDLFTEIATIAQREGLWFHIDGAWGASVLLSPTYRHLMQGVEQADSVVWDAHKMMGMTLMCSMLLVKQRGTMLNTFSTQGTDYIFHAAEEEPTDLGPGTMHCGRRVDAVKLWLTWKHLGDRGWADLIDHYFELATLAEAIINAHNSLKLITPRQSLNLCFQYIPSTIQQSADDFTLKIRQALWEEGLAMVNYAKVNGKMVFRLVLCNNQTSQADVEGFFDGLIAIGRRLEQEGG